MNLCVVVGEDREIVIDDQPVLIPVGSCVTHRPDCDHQNCACPPALAAPNSKTCGWHADTTRENLRELPELWAVLGAGSIGSGTGSDDESPQPLSDRARWEREGMRVMLVTWCKVLDEERGSPLPDERLIAARTRQEVFRHDCDARMAVAVWRAVLNDDDDRDTKRGKAMDAYRRARGRAIRAGQRRDDGIDIIEALREHIDRHLAWLLASEHADQLVHDVGNVHSSARHIAYPTRAGIRILCACGRRVPISTDKDAWMTCPGCGEEGVLSWWRTREAPATDGPQSLKDLPDWLFAHHALIVTHDQLRGWARTDRAPRMVAVKDAYRDAGGVLRPALYDPVAVAAIAHHRLGRRASA